MRTSILFSILTIFQILRTSHCSVPTRLIVDYFKVRNVLSVVYYSCQSDGFQVAKSFNEENVPVLVLKSAKFHPVLLTSKNGVIVDLSCNFVPDLLDFAVKNYLFREIISWVFVQREDKNLDLLLRTYIPLSSEVALFTYSNTSWNIQSLYSVSKSSEMILTPIQANVVEHKRKSLNGIQINCSIAFFYPERLTQVDDLRMKYLDTASKIVYQILMNLASDLNITYNLRQTDSYGYLKNGSFNGLMGHFQRKEIEIAMISAFFRPERLELIEYIAETFVLRSPIMFRQPSLASVSNIFTLPFDLDVWASFLALIVILILSQILIITTPMMRSQLSILDSMSLVLGAICQQGFSRDSVLISWRIMHFVCFLSSLFLFTSYSANIVALLQSPSNALQSMSDVTKSNLKVLVQENEYNHVLYNESTDPEVIELYNKKIKPFGEKAFETPEEGVRLIRTGRFAFQLETHTAYKMISDMFTESEKCGLKEVDSVKIPLHSIPIIKNSSYRAIFRERLTWQREVGLYDVIFKRWINQKFKCEGNVGEFKSVSLQEFRHAFMIVAFGSALALVLLLMEVIREKTRRSEKPKKKVKFVLNQ